VRRAGAVLAGLVLLCAAQTALAASTEVWLFDDPADYQYDADYIEVVNGTARLAENLTAVHARWHLDEGGGSVTADDANGTEGEMLNFADSDWVSGKMGSALRFNRSLAQRVALSQTVGNFERNDSFSVECWFATNNSVNSMALVSREQSASPYRGWLLWTLAGRVRFYLANLWPNNTIDLYTTSAGLADGQWHHVVLTYDGSSNASGVNIWVDGANQSLGIVHDTLNQTTINLATPTIGARNSSGTYFDGLIDEVVLYNRELTAEDVAYRYNNGSGRANWWYWTNSPSINATSSLGCRSVEVDFASDIPAGTSVVLSTCGLRWCLALNSNGTDTPVVYNLTMTCIGVGGGAGGAAEGEEEEAATAAPDRTVLVLALALLLAALAALAVYYARRER